MLKTGTQTLVMHMMKGMLSAREIARCSFDIPMTPALAPTIIMIQDGAPDVKPYKVVFKYRSCPAKSGNHFIRRRITLDKSYR